MRSSEGEMVLLGFPGLDVVQGAALLFGPDHQRRADVFRDIVHWYRQRFASPFYVEEDRRVYIGGSASGRTGRVEH